ncbi:MAG: radical SAM/SPASM domain-containing protein [Hyperthermus sp.]|nr:MAG: radical SAM/SPASM domain-containing protein [Hyperthermus sp.]
MVEVEEVTLASGGMSSLLAGLRILLSSPLSRMVLRASLKPSSCHVGGEGLLDANRKPLLYYALASFAGLSVKYCSVGERFASVLIKEMLHAAVRILRGDVEEARDALRDPAIRRAIALVLSGIARYGITVPQKLPAPFLVVWNFTNMCNLRCMHCYQRASRPTPDELTLEEKLEVVRQLDEAGVAAVALSGGEPTIHPHFLKVVSALSSRGIYVAVATNGWLFARKDELRKAVDAGLRYVEVSLDSADPRKHDRFRGVPGAWRRAVDALRNAVEIGVSNAMAVTLTRVNMNEIDRILDLAEKIGVERVVVFNFIPVGRGVENSWLDLSAVEREKLLHYLYRESRRRRIEVFSTAPQYSRVALQESRGRATAPTHFYMGEHAVVKALSEYIGGCGAGRIYAAIQPNGDVTPCVFLPIKVGNLRESSFMDIWLRNPLLRKLRDRSNLHEACRECPYRNVCGGCRARAYAYYGDPFAPDPGCPLALRGKGAVGAWRLRGGRERVRESKVAAVLPR